MAAPVLPTVRCTLVTSPSELERLIPAWEALRARCPAATPFQSPAWTIPWWHAFGRGGLRALAVWSGTRLVGLVPLQLRDGLRLIGAGNSDHLDALYEPGAGPLVRRAVEQLLAGAGGEVSAAEFAQLPLSSPLLEVRVAGRCIERSAGEPCPAVPLGDGATVLGDVMPARFAKKIARARHHAAGCGRLRLEGADGAPVEQALAIFGDVVRLHTAAWHARGKPGVLSDRSVQAFHGDVIRRAHPLGLLDLYRLRLDDRTVAAYYGFRDARRAYYYLSGFDPAFRALSPGTLVVAAALEAALGRGASAFDFLRGREAYKYRWGARDEPTGLLRVVS
ncbi:MAG TPA: GNAT family N-acetyltransferase [Gemmatimonadales bacterium]|jgi:CelD/BcsL family acetyltransferase involved in cellulose biosynthesis|nr:GNAT family N-acetyltransferase [Gemmatimonadales bacterium]